MKPLYWIVLGLAGILSVLLLIAGITSQSNVATIRDASDDTYASMVDSIVGSHNTHYKKDQFTITSIQYIEDTIALVKATTKGGGTLSFVFEYYDGTVYLTNYTSGQFDESDFNNSTIAPYIINAQSVS
jgi:hypothetical protein